MRRRQQPLGEVRVADGKGRITLGSRYAGRRFALREEPDGTAVLTPVLIVPEAEHQLTSGSLNERLAWLGGLADDWDGHGSKAPPPALVSYAREVLVLLRAGSAADGLRWVDPHVGANEQGEVTLEWWNGPRTLTVFVRSRERVDYLKAWGADIVGQMEDGQFSPLGDFAALWRWLCGEAAQNA